MLAEAAREVTPAIFFSLLVIAIAFLPVFGANAPTQHPSSRVPGVNGAFEDPDAEMPWVGAVCSVPDLFRFAEMLRRKGELDGARILSPAILELATRNWTGEKPNELYTIRGRERGWAPVPAYIGLGFSLRGPDLVALTRDARPDQPGGLGILRAHVAGPDDLDVELGHDLRGPVTSREHWTRSGRLGKPAPPGPGEPAPDVRPDVPPEPGDYVYVEELPEAIEKVPAEYPESVRSEGTVLVQALVGKDGRVTDTRVLKSVPELDGYALAAVRQWRFKPATAKGEPVAVWVAIPVRFSRR